MTKYVNVKKYKRGVKRSGGGGRHCVLTDCGKDAMVSGDNVRCNRMTVDLCTEHAIEHGMISCPDR